MTPPLKQENRLLAIKTAKAAGDDLAIRSMTLQEQLGRLFHLEVELSSPNREIEFSEIVGHSATIRLKLARNGQRFFNGIVSRFAQTVDEDGLAHYRATIVPWLWFLTRTSDCRIFQEMAVPDIIADVFQRHGFSDYRLSLSGSYAPKEYCVQYRETDFNFVSRLLEQEGIYYFFEHENGRHTLVLADSMSAHEAMENYEEVTYQEIDASVKDQEVISDWTMETEVQPVGYVLRDFDFKKPRTVLHSPSSLGRPHGEARHEMFDYPGEYLTHDEGTRLADIRLAELQAQHHVRRAYTNARGLATGAVFTLKGHPRPKEDAKYLITGLTLRVDAGEFTSSDPTDTAFDCEFTALDATETYRAPRMTPKPIVQGPQTAIVVGPSGEEIYTDEHARVKVHFHWDRHNEPDENASCWMRVSSNWAGKGWGGIHIPRIGQEVIVEFLEGDPDRPLITGRVYNAEQVPPYGLPGSKTQSGIKSRSTKGGGESNFNELRFEDNKGSEEVFLHGEKDLKIHVKNNETETAGSNISTNAGGNISRGAGGNISRTANQNINDKAGKDITTDSGKDMKLTAGGSYALNTNLGIHLKAMNFVAALIESGAKAAADAIKKGGGTTAAETVAGGGADNAVAGAQNTGMAALAALSPAIEAGATEIRSLQKQTGENLSAVETAGGKAGEAVADFDNAVNSGASPQVIAATFMAMASAVADSVEAAKKVIEGLLPQIPSIELWAMKDINAHALWSMSLSTKVKSISIEAQNKNVEVKGKQEVTVEASNKDINIKAAKKKVLITAKEAVNIKAEDKDVVVEAAKKKVFVKSAEQIFLKCGSATISMSKNGNIVIKGAKININGSGPVQVKGTPIKLN